MGVGLGVESSRGVARLMGNAWSLTFSTLRPVRPPALRPARQDTPPKRHLITPVPGQSRVPEHREGTQPWGMLGAEEWAFQSCFNMGSSEVHCAFPRKSPVYQKHCYHVAHSLYINSMFQPHSLLKSSLLDTLK
jgi:hypothetical protein